MGKYTSYSRTPPKPRNTGVHPLMRGIGCIMMVVVPILSWGLAILLVNYGSRHGWPIPPNWMGRIEIPPLLLSIENLRPVWNFLMAQPRLIAHVVFTAAIIVVIGGLMSVLYGYIYTIFGPPRYGPQDAPPIRVKVKRYKR
jgi:hypothetical protein